MIGVIVAAHGTLASSLVETARLVVKGGSKVAGITLNPNDDTERFQERLEKAVTELDTTSGVLVLTDMFGGTPSNVGMTLHSSGQVEVLTGVNLPMLIKALQVCELECNLDQAAETVKRAGQAAIAIASEVLARNHEVN